MTDEQYFARQPQSKSKLGKHGGLDTSQPTMWRVGSTQLHLATDNGVFSRDGLDAGTAVLIAEAPIPPKTGTFLDLGCGSGALAITLATHSPSATVWAVDINERALDVTRLNATTNHCDNVTAVPPVGVPSGTTFDLIWSNPPIRIGKTALHQLLTAWLSRLTATGEAWLVVNRNLGSDSLAKWLSEQGYVVTRKVSKRGYRVIGVVGRSAP